MVIFERRPQFIWYLREEASFYWLNLGGGLVEFFYLRPKLVVGWSFISWSMLYLEGRSSRTSYFCGVALLLRIKTRSSVRCPLDFVVTDQITARERSTQSMNLSCPCNFIDLKQSIELQSGKFCLYFVYF